MKQHADNYFVNRIPKPISQMSTNQVVTKSNEQKPTSYLTFCRNKHKRKNETALKQPYLQSSSIGAKIEYDQIALNEFKEYSVIIKTKCQINIIKNKNFTIYSNLGTRKISELQLLTSKMFFVTIQVQLQVVKYKEKCNSLQDQIKSKQKNFQKKVLKIIQIFKTHRERNEEKQSKSKTLIKTQIPKSNIYFHAQTQ
ncbi:unnamed protein product [Paramecium sonneborni]|uniref:Uncharacterized protein n=1 Tax=Paramecium sonneborni TaxID=65129 RepID=A0A8S1NKP5_9CILI|nr:unnamed protein product [Paramecium sonneborni]